MFFILGWTVPLRYTELQVMMATALMVRSQRPLQPPPGPQEPPPRPSIPFAKPQISLEPCQGHQKPIQELLQPPQRPKEPIQRPQKSPQGLHKTPQEPLKDPRHPSMHGCQDLILILVVCFCFVFFKILAFKNTSNSWSNLNWNWVFHLCDIHLKINLKTFPGPFTRIWHDRNKARWNVKNVTLVQRYLVGRSKLWFQISCSILKSKLHNDKMLSDDEM